MPTRDVRRTISAARSRPLLAVALLAAMLVLPNAMARGAAESLPVSVPSAQATPIGALPAPGPGSAANESGIFLNYFECPSGVGGGLAQLLQGCAVTNTVSFQVFGPNVQTTSQGAISLQALPAGVYSIRAALPAAAGDPVAYCGIGPSSDQQPVQVPVVVYEGFYEFELGQDRTIYCNWFRTQPGAPVPTATLYVNKHFCPPAAEFDAYVATPYELAPACQEPVMPVPFAVLKAGVEVARGVATGAPDALVFGGLATGAISVVEEVPDGYGAPVVHCTVKDEFGAARAPLTSAPVDNDRISWTLNAGDVVFCSWFNVPAPLGTTISVVKRACPDAVGYDPDGYDAYVAACTEAVADVSFKLDGASTGNPGEQLTDANGQITWSEMEADRYFLTEEVPLGYGPPVAFCSPYLPAALQNRVWQPYPVSAEGRIEFVVADGQSIACAFFNISATHPVPSPSAPVDATPDAIPDATPGGTSGTTRGGTPGAASPVAASPVAGSGTSAVTTLAIRAHRCPTGYDGRAAAADPVADCTEPPGDVVFELAALAGPTEQAPLRANTGGGARSIVTFGGVTPGDHRLTRVDFPAGGAAFVLSCVSNLRDFAPYLFAPFAVVDGDGSVRLSLVAGETVVCEWYDIAVEQLGLTVRAYACGTSQPSVAACGPATEGVRFVLTPVTGAGAPIPFQTDATGAVNLTGLSGMHTLSEIGRQPCLVESPDLDPNGNLTLATDRETVVNVFNCG